MRHCFDLTCLALTGLALTVAALLSACSYDPPPGVTVDAPEEGTWVVGDPVVLLFDRPVKAESLAVTIWPDERDIENELPPDTEPHVRACTVAKSPCGDLTLALADDRRSVTLGFDPMGLGRPDVPLLLEVDAGLEADDGAATGTHARFGLQFKPAEANVEGLEFQEGGYIIVGIVEEPVPTVLTLVSDLQIDETGALRLIGAEGDEIGEAPRNTQIAEELMVDASDQGFALFVTGQIRVTDEGERFLETDPFVIDLALGPVQVTIHDTRMTGKVLDDPETGGDRIEGTLSFSAVELANGDAAPFTFPAGSTSFTGVYAAPERMPADHPLVCGDPCGAVTVQCEPPEGFSDGFCEEGEGE